MYRILSIDGGGIRGVYAATLLERLSEASPFLDKIDLFAGTSTGAIIACALAKGLSPAEIAALYKEHAKEIFSDSMFDNVADLAVGHVSVVGAQYNLDGLRDVLFSIFGNDRLETLPHVLIPTFDLDANREPRMWAPKFFHNFAGPDSDGHERIVDVLLRSCAAPMYFPSHQGFIDGGLVANNPSMAALAQALDAATGGQRPQDIVLFSVGTGISPQHVAGQTLDWGAAQWAPHIIDMMMEGMLGVADYQCARILRDRYWRLCPVLDHRVRLDDVSQIDALAHHAKSIHLDKTKAWVAQHLGA